MSGDKSLIFKLILLVIFIIISLRLFYLQIYEDKYHELSENNTVHLESVYPSRGIIFDRYDSVIVENKPTYDFYIIPKQFSVRDTTKLLNSFSLSIDEFKNINGVGEGKVNKFGSQFVELIKKHIQENNITKSDEIVLRTSGSKSSKKLSLILPLKKSSMYECIDVPLVEASVFILLASL